jgi:hypothetical protein
MEYEAAHARPEVASVDANAMALGYGSKSLAEGMSRRRSPSGRARTVPGATSMATANAATADRDLGGFISGMDAQISDSWRVALATGASFLNFSGDFCRRPPRTKRKA